MGINFYLIISKKNPTSFKSVFNLIVFSKASECSELKANASKSEGAELLQGWRDIRPAVPFSLGEHFRCAVMLQPRAVPLQQDVVLSLRHKRFENKDLKLRKTPEKSH